ncbi:MAG: ATP-binding protein [Muribaculaceae bacterium]|nr:ATP-binding protein [Muribaculaceae bacterium]
MKQSYPVKYPIGIQSFAEIRQGGYLYVDKTEIIYRLIQDSKYYFLSRPRRFGKSLLLSTLEAYYLGKRELFKGLALDSLTEDWEPHPVLHLDLNYGNYDEPNGLEEILNNHLIKWEKEYGISDTPATSPAVRFNNIIQRAYEQTGKKVVILIDEYDKPLLNTIDKPELADIYRSKLKAFYGNLKTMDAYIRLAVLTGVARFSKVSIFSDLNNLRDISFSTDYAAICGITSEELDEYFGVGIERLADKMRLTVEATREELRRRYDGYHFAEASPDIYNPFSLVNVFADNSMKNYWFHSGTPSYLVKLISKDNYRFRDIAPITIGQDYLESAGLLDRNPAPVFYQSGYLTIKEYLPLYRSYRLDYPNEEVKVGFLNFLLRSYIPDADAGRGFSITDFLIEVDSGNPYGFMDRMKSLIADVPYGDKGTPEDHFQNAIYLLFTLLGYFTRMEDRTSNGRIDLQVETPSYVYIFEFKIDSTARKAMEQMREKRYWERESMSGKEIFLIGANFDTKTKRLTDDILIEQP